MVAAVRRGARCDGSDHGRRADHRPSTGRAQRLARLRPTGAGGGGATRPGGVAVGNPSVGAVLRLLLSATALSLHPRRSRPCGGAVLSLDHLTPHYHAGGADACPAPVAAPRAPHTPP